MPGAAQWSITLDHWPPTSEFSVSRVGLEAARIGHRVHVTVADEQRDGVFVDLHDDAEKGVVLVVRLDD